MKVLWVGDAACDSGFAKCTHEILDVVRERSEVTVMGLNFRGDPDHDYPYKIYPAFVPTPGRRMDVFGVGRLRRLVADKRPDVVVFQNDPWNIPPYVEELADMPEHARPALVGGIAVDGANCRGRDLNGLDHVVFWTDFARKQATDGGFTKPSSVVPLGVDRAIFKPALYDKAHLRKLLGLPERTWNGFFFLNVNRNQPRKRLDLTLRAFAEFYHRWREDHELDDPEPFLYLHVCPTGDQGYDLEQLAVYYKVNKQIILAEPGVYRGASEAEVVATYQAADVQISTTQGEGWGLTTLEGMACGVPQIVPDWSALGEWARSAAYMIRCTSTIATAGRVNSIGGIADADDMVDALDSVYRTRPLRRQMIEDGLALAARPEFSWKNIGARWATILEEVWDAHRRERERKRCGAAAAGDAQVEVPGGSRPGDVSGDPGRSNGG